MRQSLEERLRIGAGPFNPDVKILRVTRLRVDHHGVCADDRVPHAGRVESVQQIFVIGADHECL